MRPSLTEAGYLGDDVESLLSRLLQAANGDVGAAQQGIVFIDEIDKLQRNGSGFKDMRKGVQSALLKMLEGTIATVPQRAATRILSRPASHSTRPRFYSYAAGHSLGLEDIIAKRLGRGGFGFGRRWIVKWSLMDCCGRSGQKTWRRSG